ncbi:hypothetical protein [Bacteroides stercorirosoris]|uniref:Uncharacterized protein n=1 Tax=Bacteroides stercorirosoris TaxID=871324 RepID=A0A1M6HFQ8_9BACE|nr:hypothetical protein [Bacteroides stercorirosoris]SHJ21051.1 hypothetical protein SAMN05444350_11850 [Bacteroides stercorirosoris]
MEKINETHILVLKEHNGIFQVASIPIDDSFFIINEIKASVDNPNKTLLDVQSEFLNNFQSINNAYGYLYPYAYSSSYVSGAIKPKKYTYAEYKTELDNRVKNKVIGENINIDKIIEDENRILKQSYASLCTRYIKQQMLYKAFQNAANDSSCKMYSRELIGWSSFDYAITDDIKVCIYTNLGFGYASYFTLSISYKDIIIAPFSHIAKYYNACMTDIIRCTRDYYVEKDNWYPMFELVKDFVNHSLEDPKSFVESYIMNEIDEMIRCLRNIMANPFAIINMFKNQNNNLDYHRLRFINPMSNDEKQLYSVYPIEMPTIFKSEKLSQAVNTLKRLEELQKIHSQINVYIEEILNMIIELSPEIDKTIKSIQVDIERLVVQKKPKEELAESLQTQIDGFVSELNNELEKLPKDADWKRKEDVRKQFEERHPIYIDTKNRLQEVKDEIYEINKKIYSRKSLVERLFNSNNNLAPYMASAV